MSIKMYIKVTLNKVKKKGREFINLVRALFLKEVGKIISNLKASSYCLMETYLLVHLEIIIAMKEFINTKMETFIKVNGRDKSKVEMENLSFQMVNNIQVNLKKVESMDMELINGRMEISTQVIFSKTIDKD